MNYFNFNTIQIITALRLAVITLGELGIYHLLLASSSYQTIGIGALLASAVILGAVCFAMLHTFPNNSNLPLQAGAVGALITVLMVAFESSTKPNWFSIVMLVVVAAVAIAARAAKAEMADEEVTA